MLTSEAIKRAFEGALHKLAARDREFAGRVYGGDFARYARRLSQYGMFGRASVLDAGAGVGQWAVTLAGMNRSVTALEFDPARVDFLSAMKEELDLKNLTVKQGSVVETGFEGAVFDTVFCYGVIEQTPWKEVLMEFARVLGPEGLLYVNANGPGWYRFLWDTEHNASKAYDPRAYAARAFASTLSYERGEPVQFPSPVMITPEQLRDHLERVGFVGLIQGSEGTTRANGAPTDPPFFKGSYKEDPCVHEVLATRTGDAPTAHRG